MVVNPFFHYTRLQYDLKFDDIYSITETKATGIIDHLFDEVYEIAVDYLLSDRYLLVLSLLDHKRMIYLNSIVGDVYDSFMLSIHSHLDDLGYYCQQSEAYMVDDPTDSRELHRAVEELKYLTHNEPFIKDQMTTYTHLLFTNIYHNVYLFIQEAKKRGVYFSTMGHSQCPITNVRTIICYTNQEVIKNHDTNWYDRLSLLHSV